MNDFEISDLLLFCQVVDSGSLSEAAKRSGRTRSAVSQRLGRLEERLGARLLLRTTRHLELTEEGQSLYQRGKVFEELYQDTLESLSARKGELQGAITMTYPAAISRSIVQPAIRDFLEQHPAVSLELIPSDKPLNLVNEQLDLALRVGQPEDSSLTCLRLGSLRDVLCFSPQLPGAERLSDDRQPDTDESRISAGMQPDQRSAPQKGNPSPEEEPEQGTQPGEDHNKAFLERLRDLPHLACPWQAGALHYRFPSGDRPLGLKVSPRIRCHSMQEAHTLVQAGLGIGFLPEVMIRDDLEQGRLRACPLQPEGQLNPVYALHPYRQLVPARVRALLTRLQAQFREAGRTKAGEEA
ncbi:LysR family transcriptional regulator [Kiloniella sp. b19]|uniref:LysR family transcriptional regulator n=1 Tax=Kiloniella sp. GXU_MW_B19 TaxID=3141326 RepID=UPI0031D641E9